MAILTIPEELRTLLAGLSERTELRDPTGNSLGIFTPQKLGEDEAYEWAIAEFKKRGLLDAPPPGDDTEGFTIEEVIASVTQPEAV